MTEYSYAQVEYFRNRWNALGTHLSRNEAIERMEASEITAHSIKDWTFDCPFCNGEALPEGWQPDTTALRVRCPNCNAVWFEDNYLESNCPHLAINIKKGWSINYRQHQKYGINYGKAVLENTITSCVPYEAGGTSTELLKIDCAWCKKRLFNGEGHGPTDLAALSMSLENWDKIVDYILEERVSHSEWPLKGEIKDQ